MGQPAACMMENKEDPLRDEMCCAIMAQRAGCLMGRLCTQKITGSVDNFVQNPLQKCLQRADLLGLIALMIF